MLMSSSRPGSLRWATVALAAGLAWALAGCGGDSADNPPAAQPTVTAEPSAPSTVPPAPSEPVSPAPGTTTPPPPGDRGEPPDRRRPPVAGEVKLRRSGGFLGTDQTLVVYADGAWAYQEGRGEIGKPLGKLSADQRRQLRALVNSPALRAEAGDRSGPGVCNDGYVYALSTPEVNVSWNDCGSEPATAASIASLLISWTPM